MAGDNDGYRVGFSVNMSVDLANVSQFDVHYALQGFSVWTEETPGLASYWHFVMPNLHGNSNDGKNIQRYCHQTLPQHGNQLGQSGHQALYCSIVPGWT
jgi:hypothetical protein